MKELDIKSPEAHKTASNIIEEIKSVDRRKREEIILNNILEGHVPSHMKYYVDIVQTFVDKAGNSHVLTINVLSDYLSIGSDIDYLRIPLNPLTVQKLCDVWGCTMPTTKISDIIWNAAPYKLQPLPWGPPYDASMMSVDRLVTHNNRIQNQIKKISDFDPFKIIAGHKKDVVITNKLIKQPNQVSIYGWHQLDGKPIQPLYLGHENTYADYSHGARLISLSCLLDDNPISMLDIVSDENLCHVVSAEGKMQSLRQPGILFDKTTN